MNRDEYEAFRAESVQKDVPTVSAEEVGGGNRTLAYGYDADRNSFHAYLHDGFLHVRTYNCAGRILRCCNSTSLPAELLLPGKRVYPQYTDRDFARIMRDLGCPLPFGNWSEPRREGPYFGRTHFDRAARPEG